MCLYLLFELYIKNFREGFYMKKEIEKEEVDETSTGKDVKKEEVKAGTAPAEAKKPVSETKKKAKKAQEEIEELQSKLKISEEKLLRSHAEFENFRKRGIRERSDIRKNTQLDTLSAILPVLDHFELALNAAGDAKNVNAVLDGMKLIKAEFAKALNSLGVDTINAVGEVFNPEIHEAIANEVSEEYEKDVVVKQWRAGYKLGDRLIRPATVVVSSGSDSEEAE